MHSSQNSPSVSKYPGNPGILGQGGFCSSQDNPPVSAAEYPGNPGILGQGRFEVCTHPRIVLQCPSILGIPGYLDKGGLKCALIPG